MCGIVGYIGKKETTKILLDGLKELEYRGYDSAGIAVLKDNRIDVFKALGKLVNLEEKVNKSKKEIIGKNDFELFENKYAQIFRENDLKVLRPKKKLSEKESENIIKFLRNKVGTLYSVKEAIISGKKIRPESSQSQMQFCSRLVAQAYLHIGHKIVENPNFCQPAEIENSNFFEEVPDIIRKARKEEIEFVSTKNFVLENQISTYKWLNNTRDYAKSEFGYEKIHSQNDVMNFLKEYPEADNIVSGYINESGYLENYKIEKDNNPWLFDADLFIKKYNYDTINIRRIIDIEFENIQSYVDRIIDNYIKAAQNVEILKFNYFKLEKNLHKNRLSFIIKKYTTFIKASEYVLKGTIKDKDHNSFSIVSNNMNILNEEKNKLEELLIE